MTICRIYNVNIAELPADADLNEYLVLETESAECLDYILDNGLFSDGFVMSDGNYYPYPNGMESDGLEVNWLEIDEYEGIDAYLEQMG